MPDLECREAEDALRVEVEEAGEAAGDGGLGDGEDFFGLAVDGRSMSSMLVGDVVACVRYLRLDLSSSYPSSPKALSAMRSDEVVHDGGPNRKLVGLNCSLNRKGNTIYWQGMLTDCYDNAAGGC